eukprot:gene17222-21955_t
MSGSGVATYFTGDKFQGFWYDDKRHGKGEFSDG